MFDEGASGVGVEDSVEFTAEWIVRNSAGLKPPSGFGGGVGFVLLFRDVIIVWLRVGGCLWEEQGVGALGF